MAQLQRQFTDMAPCRTCGRPCRGILCGACFARAPRCGGEAYEHETDEDLERIVEEQMQCLPPWWEAEEARHREEEAREYEQCYQPRWVWNRSKR